jgi:hypothetical protein
MKAELTDTGIRSYQPRAAQYSIGDAACPGLCVRSTPKGVKSFAYAYRNKRGGAAATTKAQTGDKAVTGCHAISRRGAGLLRVILISSNNRFTSANLNFSCGVRYKKSVKRAARNLVRASRRRHPARSCSIKR